MKRAARLEKYRNGDFLQYLHNVLEMLTEARAEKLELVPSRAELQKRTNDFATHFQPAQGSELTAEIAALDDRRDRAFTGIKLQLKALQYHYKPSTVQHAERLLDKLNDYGDRIPLMRYQLETATLAGLLKDWKTQCTDSMTALALTGWVNELEEANNQLNEKYVARTQEKSLQNAGALRELRITLTKTYRRLVAQFEARALLFPSDLFSVVTAEWDSLIAEYNRAVAGNSHKTTQDDDTGEGNIN